MSDRFLCIRFSYKIAILTSTVGSVFDQKGVLKSYMSDAGCEE